jgi:hypothetical protein
MRGAAQLTPSPTAGRILIKVLRLHPGYVNTAITPSNLG